MGKKRTFKKKGISGVRPANYTTDLVRENEKFERYYNSVLNLSEDEKQQFWDTLRRDLPNSFRFTGGRKHALALQELLKNFYIPKITSIEYEGELVEPPRPLPWYPDQLAWSMTTPKKIIRRFAPFASFQKFLVAETEVGNISRQEVVSMIPPLLMDIKPGMVVLDMCAAPGSKSAQLMEMIHAGEEDRMEEIARKLENGDEATRGIKIEDLLNGDAENKDQVDDDGRSTGLLIANDSDYKRAHLLIHQMKRLNSPNLIVTNHDATLYPSIRLPSEKGAEDKPLPKRYLKFDRILADVPCSGDGTPRKNFNVWTDWNPANGIGLHVVQSRILTRALQMLKVGGRVVYSTCSLNPVENEAIIASVIEQCGGSTKVEIVDCSAELPELKRYPGLKTWTVMDKTGTIWEKWEDAEVEIRQNNPTLNRVTRSMFPPSNEDEGVDLTRCMRVYPHSQDTGGFFITVLEKKSEIRVKQDSSKTATPKGSTVTPSAQIIAVPAKVEGGEEEEASLESPKPSSLKRGSDEIANEPEAKRTRISEGAEPEAEKVPQSNGQSEESKPPQSTAPVEQSQSEKPKQKRRQRVEEPFKYLDPTHKEITGIFNYYEIASQFPRDRFMVRNADGLPSKTIYYTSALTRDIMVENENTGIKFVHCGVKMFVKQDVQTKDVCPWRIQMEGLPVVESWVGSDRIVKMYKKATLRTLLVEMFPKVGGGGWKNLGEIGEQVRDMDMGCSILRLEPTDSEDGFKERMIFPIWRSLYSVNLMLPKEERRAVLLQLFDEEVTPIQKRDQGATNVENEEESCSTPNVNDGEGEDVSLAKEDS
ncbi:hypothetical protein FQN57_006511 [Myotisia sp. PD_48]|nr:hypothetical protein FQN57_006511 [Myotisia sp. PD_48]